MIQAKKKDYNIISIYSVNILSGSTSCKLFTCTARTPIWNETNGSWSCTYIQVYYTLASLGLYTNLPLVWGGYPPTTLSACPWSLPNFSLALPLAQMVQSSRLSCSQPGNLHNQLHVRICVVVSRLNRAHAHAHGGRRARTQLRTYVRTRTRYAGPATYHAEPTA